jgi:replicative DNA helicase
MKDIDASLHKVPPQNLEAEQSVLGGILLDNLALNTVLELLETSDFYSEAHRKIFSSIIELSNRNEPCDLITLSNILKDQKRIEQVGGAAYLASLVDNVPSAVNIAYYAKIIKEKSILRRLIGTATEILNKSYDAGMDIDSVLDQAEHAIFEISENKIRPSFYPIRDIIKDSFKTIERLYAKKELVTGVATGFDKIDDITSGLQNSDLIIIAGRPSMGKTAFALNIAQYAALEMGVSVAIFSLEMAKEQLATRMLAAEARVDSQRLRKGFLGETDWPKLTTAAGRLSEAPIYIDDTPAITAIEMKAKSRRLKAENGLGLIILDYLQLMRGSSSRDSREQEISEISRSLKALAKELSVPVIALSQLNRKVEDRTSRRPQMADLRESGAIEQDADLIAFIYRDEVYNRSDDNPEKGIAEIIIGKQRNGPTGMVKLAFQEKYTRFENLARTEDGP